jgi:hypothetical protein
MVIVDTSIWINHLRAGDPSLVVLLQERLVLIHPFIIGELACGQLTNRGEVLELLQNLPQAPSARDSDVLQFIEQRRLMGRGIGYIDAHLLAATALEHAAQIWTRDRRLKNVADELGLGYAAH